MSEQNVFHAVAETLEGRFTTDASDRGNVKEDGFTKVTLHAAIREVFGMDREAGLCAYFDHRDWHARSRAVHGALDALVSERPDVRTTAVLWSVQPHRTESEVLELLREAADRHSDLTVPPAAVRRPQPRRMPHPLKRRAAVCGMLAHLREGLGESYGAVIEQLIGDRTLSEMTAAEILDLADAVATTEKLDPSEVDKGEIPALLSKAWEASSHADVGRFLAAVSGDEPWADISDHELARRLAEFTEAAGQAAAGEDERPSVP